MSAVQVRYSPPRGVAQFGRALALGARCRRFESCHPDCLDIPRHLSYTRTVNIQQQMSRSPFFSKFKTDIKKLTAAVEGTVYLDEEYPKLYEKLYKYYKSRNIYFYDDAEKDYNVILDNVEYDLMDAGVLV